jgi:nitroreductase
MDEHMENSVLLALKSRRSTPRVQAHEPPRDVIEAVIAAATWAPNHYLTNPWRFVILTGEARTRLGEAMARACRKRLDDPDSVEAVPLLEKERRKPLRAPVIIAVAVVPSDLPKSLEIEEVAAGAAGVQNMLLAAHSLGLGAMWRTGWPAYDPEIKQFLQLPATAHLLAFVYLGYPEPGNPTTRRIQGTRHARWMTE